MADSGRGRHQQHYWCAECIRLDQRPTINSPSPPSPSFFPPTFRSLCPGLLDIFGFEDCGLNSLEQLCINFANERLQNHFVQHMLQAERKIYEAEGLASAFSMSNDNTACLQLMAGPISIFSLLNEDSR